MSRNKALLCVAAAFFIWDALTAAGLPGEPWLIPGGLAALALSLLI